MPEVVSVTLKTLRCIQESDRGGSSHSEPYIWPFLLDLRTFESRPAAAFLAESRKIIRDEMKAGQSAAIDGPGNVLTLTLKDGAIERNLMLAVALWEADDFPVSAVQAGYQAYLDALKDHIRRNIGSLNTAFQTNNQERLQEIIAEIKKPVEKAVGDAIRSHLSGLDKFKSVIGSLNRDDFLATDFALFADPLPKSFTLDFAGVAGDKRRLSIPGPAPVPILVDAPIHFQLDGTISVSGGAADPCQAEIDAVNDAEDALRSLQNRLHSLQQQLGKATPQQKPVIVARIREINEHQIPAAQRKIEQAKQALRLCQTQHPWLDGNGRVVANAV